MTYIIENANLYKQNQLVTTSLLVDRGKILAVQPDFSKYLYMKMSANDFVMTSTHVFYVDGLPDKNNQLQCESYFSSNYLQNGCTTVLVTAYVTELDKFESSINEIRKFYEQSPLDYTIAVKIPVKYFTVPFVQKCKQKKIPAIFVEFEDRRDLYKIPWGWIREALFPYNSPIIPVIKNDDINQGQLLQTWQKILKREKIPHLFEPLEENTPLSLSVLKKIGIYPLKGYLQTGGELSYNLFLAKNGKNIREEVNKEQLSLAITVHKGKVVRVGENIHYYLENGEEFIVNRPAFFK